MSRKGLAVGSAGALTAVGIAVGAYLVQQKTTSSYDQAISYARRLPSFAPKRTVEVSTAPQLKAAIADLRPGDLVKATTGFTVPGETVITNRLSAPAEIDLTGVRFLYTGGADLPAVWLDNAKNLRIFGGDASTADTGGACIVDYGSQRVIWWRFTAHDCGGSGIGVSTTNAPVDHDDFQGTIWKSGQNLNWDPHAEKGTGLHGAILWDSKQAFGFTNNRFAFYIHDVPTGACVELGNKRAAEAGGNVLYEKCVKETEVAKIQTGGNGLQLWGYTGRLGLDVKYLEVVKAEGYALWGGGVYPGQTLSGVTVQYGRASDTNLNPRYAGQSPWGTRNGGPVYGRVQPAPAAG
jgi:hypothetical protein